MMFKINVLIITYKQQDVIGRTIESVLIQKNYGLNKIVIVDDCSPDKTWDIVSQYVQKYPCYIEAYQNERNLGIYQNMDVLVSKRGDADLYYFLSGDDALEDGVFKTVQDFIKNEGVNVAEAVGIYCDWKDIYLDGKEIRCSPTFIKSIQPISLYIRGMVGGRSQFLSKKVLNQFTPSIYDKGLALAESLFDSQAFRYSEKFYYIPQVGSISYRGIGVSTQLGIEKSDYWTKQRIDAAEYFIDNIVSQEEDIFYEKYIIEYSKFYINPSLWALFRTLRFYHKGKLNGVHYSINDYIQSIYPLMRYLMSRLIKNNLLYKKVFRQ